MSVVAVKRSNRSPYRWVFAYDSIAAMGTQIIPPTAVKYSKVWQYQGMTTGSVGNVSESLLMEAYNAAHQPEDDTMDSMLDYSIGFYRFMKQKTGEVAANNSYLMAIKDNVYWMWGKGSILPVNDWMAIGAGQVEANASLRNGTTAKEAVITACELNTMCRLPVHEVTHRG